MIIVFSILYLALPPSLFALGKLLKNQIKYAIYGRRQSSTAIQNDKEGFNRKLSKRIKFTIKDPRNKPIPFRIVFLLIYVIGLAVSILAGYLGNWKLFLIALVIAYISIIFSYVAANKVVTERDKVIKRILELKGTKMRFVNKEKSTQVTPDTEFRIFDWADDLTHPTKMELYMPTDFDILSVTGFMESFNLIFGANGQWVADEDKGGFDFNAGVANIKVTDKLPQIAMWHERYLNSKDIHWSYFPLALGSENGVPVYNDELDITENVLGFAVNSGQEKLSKKNEVQIGPEITASPQVLIAGGTGGGKSVNSNTLIRIISKNQDCK